jgi:hypothetical protein
MRQTRDNVQEKENPPFEGFLIMPVLHDPMKKR